jgi:hypothetical protein
MVGLCTTAAKMIAAAITGDKKTSFRDTFKLTLRDAGSKALTGKRIADCTAANNGTERAPG